MVVKVILRGMSYAPGMPNGSPTERETLGEMRSAWRSEFYAAKTAGISLDAVVSVRGVNYRDEEEAEINGKIYTVVRADKTDPRVTVLNLTRR